MMNFQEKEISLESMQELPIIGRPPKNEAEEKFLKEVGEYEFQNLEEPGLTHSFAYGNRNKSHTFVFYHGQKRKVPRFIARHLEDCKTPIWNWRPDGTGRMDKQLIGSKPRFQMRQTFAH